MAGAFAEVCPRGDTVERQMKLYGVDDSLISRAYKGEQL